jgi:hypothetical protein
MRKLTPAYLEPPSRDDQRIPVEPSGFVDAPEATNQPARSSAPSRGSAIPSSPYAGFLQIDEVAWTTPARTRKRRPWLVPAAQP